MDGICGNAKRPKCQQRQHANVSCQVILKTGEAARQRSRAAGVAIPANY